MSKRFYCDHELEYRNYGIFDLTKSDKTKEDFYDKKEEAYDLVHFEIYLVDETDSMLTGEEVCDTLNQYESKNKEICKYIQRKINECDSPTKLDEIGVLTDPGAAWGYCKALNQIKKGLQYRGLWVDDTE